MNTLEVRDGELGYPEALESSADYTSGPLSLIWSLRYIDLTVIDTDGHDKPRRGSPHSGGLLQFRFGHVPRPQCRDLAGKHFELSAGVNNLFDEEPPIEGRFEDGRYGGFDQIGHLLGLVSNSAIEPTLPTANWTTVAITRPAADRAGHF